MAGHTLSISVVGHAKLGALHTLAWRPCLGLEQLALMSLVTTRRL